jgi:hypothetical protein
MRVGSAAAAAVAVLCAAVTAADGAVAAVGGPVLTKAEVTAEVDAALGRAGIDGGSGGRVLVLDFTTRKGHKPRPECLFDHPTLMPASRAQVDVLLAGLERAGWRRTGPPEAAVGGRAVDTSLHRGGWRLTVSRMALSAQAGTDIVAVDGMRQHC